jgi:hypothetical protein
MLITDTTLDVAYKPIGAIARVLRWIVARLLSIDDVAAAVVTAAADATVVGTIEMHHQEVVYS